ASSLAIEAGDMVRAGRRAGVVAAETKSSTTDMVTEFDRASEQLLVTRIRATRPHDGIVGEEGSSTVGTSGVSWLIDPIDGTTNFLYDIPAWAVSVAAVDAEGPLAAAVYAPALGELFTARRGGGATLNGVPIACGRSADLSTSLVATGFSYVAARRVEQAARVARMIGHVRDVRRFGAASPRRRPARRNRGRVPHRRLLRWRDPTRSGARGQSFAVRRPGRPDRAKLRLKQANRTGGTDPADHLPSCEPWVLESWQWKTTSGFVRL
ncbi:MAG: myo-inositol-1(or 4)-monophosphatase, partial [Acidimicrobiaceae bacterium]